MNPKTFSNHLKAPCQAFGADGAGLEVGGTSGRGIQEGDAADYRPTPVEKEASSAFSRQDVRLFGFRLDDGNAGHIFWRKRWE